MRTSIAVALFMLAAPLALAGTITSINPETIGSDGGDALLTASGYELGTVVRFAGPAGTFEVDGCCGGSAVEVRVPPEVVKTPGSYAITVLGGPTGDSNSANFQVTEASSHELTIAPHDPVTAVAESREGAHVFFEVDAYGGRDPNPKIVCDPPSGSLFPLGQTYVRCIATNSYGERAQGSVYVYVYDTGHPVLKLPDQITVRAESKDGTVVTYEATATDVIDGEVPVTCSHPSGSRFPVGMTTVACTATDSSENVTSGTFDVHVVSEEPETLMIHVPAAITAEAQGSFGAEVLFTVTADGTSDPNPEISCDPSSGSIFPLGKTTVNCVARDKFGNTAADDFDITIVDTTAPVLNLPDPIVANTDSADGAVVNYDANASDTVSGDFPATCEPPSGSRFPVGTTTVQCSATDDAGNTARGTFTVEVRRNDTGTLTIRVPDPITTEAESHDGAVVTFTVTAGGTSDPDPDITCAPASGSTFALGTTTVSCTATDQSGNTASDDFEVNVVDTISPVISSVTATPEELHAPNHKLVPVSVSVTAADVADAMPRCFVFQVTANEDISGDFEIRSDLEVELRAEREKNARVYTVHVRCVDDSANAADDSVNVVVPKGQEETSPTTPAPPPTRKPFRKWW
jgi:HYR domain